MEINKIKLAGFYKISVKVKTKKESEKVYAYLQKYDNGALKKAIKKLEPKTQEGKQVNSLKVE